MKTKKDITTTILALLIASFCYSQEIYQTKLLPKVKQKMDSLYPKATDIAFTQFLKIDTAQEVSLKCNCPESPNEIILLFDTTGNLLNKDIFISGINDLPDTILNYMKANTSPSVKFFNKFIAKSITNKGEIDYSIQMMQWHHVNGNPIEDDYWLKFKSNGEFISKKKIPEGRL